MTPLVPTLSLKGTRLQEARGSLFTAIDQSPGEKLGRIEIRRSRGRRLNIEPSFCGSRVLWLPMDSRLEDVFCGTVHSACKVIPDIRSIFGGIERISDWM